MKTMQDDIKSVLYTEEQLHECVQKIADQINRDYQGKEIYAIGILKGAMVFYADLVRAINVPVAFDFMAASSYGKSASSSGEVKILRVWISVLKEKM